MRPETILVVDDEKLIRWSIRKHLEQAGFSVFEARSAREALKIVSDHQPDVVILDQRMEEGTGIEILQEFRRRGHTTAVIMLTAIDKSELAVQAMKLGAADYLTKPVNFEELEVVVEKALESTLLKRRIAHLLKEQAMKVGGSRLIGNSPAFRNVVEHTSRVAQSGTTTVLLTGESGTGKEVVARAIHDMSERGAMPFVAVNCSALAESLAESELFGHEKGAFTDAHSQRRGLFELADKGTVFLDEVGDSSPAVQAKLLRVLEEKVIRRVGGTADINVDLRVIAATNQSLEHLIQEGRFRKDLFYRLNVAQIHLPPVRERGKDILLLAEYFLNEFNERFHKHFKGLADETRKIFMEYDWPGNVREIRNVIERAVLLDEGDFIFSHQVQVGHLHHLSDPETPSGIAQEEPASLQELEKRALIDALRRAGNNQSEAARILKITRDTLRYRMRKHGLPSGGGASS